MLYTIIRCTQLERRAIGPQACRAARGPAESNPRLMLLFPGPISASIWIVCLHHDLMYFVLLPSEAKEKLIKPVKDALKFLKR
jgi:hypothetical protein